MKRYRFFIKANIVLIFAFVFNTAAYSQITVILNPFKPIGQTNVIDLSLVNNTNYSGPATIVATLSLANGKAVMTQKTIRKITANNITIVKEVSDVETNFIDYSFKKQYESMNGLPPLNYTLCVNVKAMDNPAVGGEACNNYLASDILTLTPLYPGMEDVIFEQRPPLHWVLAGAPPGFFNYSIKLAKVMGEENSNRSIKRNFLYINKKNINETNLFYPMDALELERGEEYAWQVEVTKDNSIIMKSDVWVFTVEDTNKYIELPRNLPYVNITKIDEGITLFAVGEFKFKFPALKETKIVAQLYEVKEGGNKSIELSDNQFYIVPGTNKLKLDLSDQVYLKHLNIYSLLLKDTSSSMIYQMFIQYVNPDYIK